VKTAALRRGRMLSDRLDQPPRASRLPLGACSCGEGKATFCVWAPLQQRVRVRIEAPEPREFALHRDELGYHTAVADNVAVGSLYRYVLDDGQALPDPASRHQPQGVHGPSEVVPVAFPWKRHAWPAPDLRHMVLYELHVGTFTKEGTFDAAIGRLEELRDLGITAIELMPLAQFPGERNWGYDGVFAFAVQSSYGGPNGLKRFVDAAHATGLHVILDVVYNHVGPEGNYLPLFGPYFTDLYHTPWGPAVNFDGAESDEVRRYFIESALQWIDEFRIDGLRLDAVHAIHDRSAQPFLRELAAAVRHRAEERARRAVVIAESDLGDPRVVRPERLGGLGMDAQWLDDFHHALRTLITDESDGYYADFGTLQHLERAFRQGYVYAGEYSHFRRRRHGAPGPDILPRQFVVFAQNHDQVGNRMFGDRLTAEQHSSPARLAAAAVLLSPFTPLLFMGEEYGETRPFPYFVSHADEQLVEAVRRGRREEFQAFEWAGEPPDPQSPATFASAVLDWSAREHGSAVRTLALYRRLLELRRTSPAICAAESLSAEALDVDGQPARDDAREGVLIVRRRAAAQSSILILNFSDSEVPLSMPAAAGRWDCAVDTCDPQWGGPAASISGSLEAAPTLSMVIRARSAVLLLHDEA
jgi:maltooligosyltrehalose trehalohydrolase